MASISIRFTKQALDKIKPPVKLPEMKGSVYDSYKDTGEKGLQCIVTHSGSKVFYFRAKVRGRSERVKLGSYPAMSIEQARKEARLQRTVIDAGKNPNDEKKRVRGETSFGRFFEQDYMKGYAKLHKKSWGLDEDNYRLHMQSLKRKALSDISRNDVQRLHGKVTESAGAYVANRVVALISKVYSLALDKGWEGVNPATGVKKNKEKSRDRFMTGDELARFFEAMKEEPNTTIRDYILLSLFCGQRKSNMMAMRWDEVDFANGLWKIVETKNGESQTVALTTPALEILRNRQATGTNNPWVFPSPKSASGHLEEPKGAWKRVLQRANIQNLRIHDLRRTIGSYMAMGGANQYLIGAALGHKSANATAIYARVAVDPVRDAQEMAATRIVELMQGG